MSDFSIGKRIKFLRVTRGISVAEFARRIGKSRTTVYRYESDEIEEMPYTVLVPIARALGTSPAYLLGYDEELEEKNNNKSTELIEAISRIDFSPEETKELLSYIEFIISKRKG